MRQRGNDIFGKRVKSWIDCELTLVDLLYLLNVYGFLGLSWNVVDEHFLFRD